MPPSVNNLGKYAKSYLPLMLSLVLFAYFAIHFTTGNHGLEARDHVMTRVEAHKATLAALKSERKIYEKRIALLQKERISPDLADELARKTLQYANPDEFVLFDQ